MIDINFDTTIRQFSKKLGIDFKKLENAQVPLKRSGLFMLKSTDDNFRNESTPDGVKWPLLRPVTIALRKKGTRTVAGRLAADKILQDTGQLKRSVETFTNTKTIMSIRARRKEGSEDIAAKHQFGDKDNEFFGRSAPVPQREYLGFSDKDIDANVEIFADWVMEVLNK